MIYLIQAGDSGPVKIGIAANILTRFSGLQSHHHEPLRILRTFEGDRAEELYLHGRFRDCHIRGEWFTFHADMLGNLGLDEAEIPSPRTKVTRTPVDVVEVTNERLPLQTAAPGKLEFAERIARARIDVKKLCKLAGIPPRIYERWQSGSGTLSARIYRKLVGELTRIENRYERKRPVPSRVPKARPPPLSYFEQWAAPMISVYRSLYPGPGPEPSAEQMVETISQLSREWGRSLPIASSTLATDQVSLPIRYGLAEDAHAFSCARNVPLALPLTFDTQTSPSREP